MDGNEMLEAITEVKVELGKHETSIKQAFKMINEQKEETKAIHSLATSIEKIACEMMGIRENQEEMKKNQNQLNDKIETIEHRPIKTFDAIKMQFILSSITVIVGILIGKLL